MALSVETVANNVGRNGSETRALSASNGSVDSSSVPHMIYELIFCAMIGMPS